MRPLSLILLTLSALAAAEPYPLWDGQESVADYAKKVNLPPTQSLDLGNGVKLDLVLIPAGTFIMGSPEPEKPIVGQTMVGVSGGALFVIMVFMLIRARKKRTRLQFSMAFMLLLTFVSSIGVWGGVRWNEALKGSDVYPNEYPAHSVTLTHPYYLGKYEVTQEQYEAVIGTNPSHFKGKDNPVETVSWNYAQAFCQKLSEQTKKTVQLPTEAEWEYACKTGTRTRFHSGDTEADLDHVAWYDGNSKFTTHPVGQKEANTFGLFDMHGNVLEWCADGYGKYPAEPVINPSGAEFGSDRVLRGGSWGDFPRLCRSASRYYSTPVIRLSLCGFRVMMRVSSKTP